MYCLIWALRLANLTTAQTPRGLPSFLLQLRVRSLGILILNQRSRVAHIQPFRAYDTFGGEKERVRVSEAAHWISIHTFSILSFLRASYHIERWRKVWRGSSYFYFFGFPLLQCNDGKLEIYTLIEGTNVIPPRRRPQNLYHRKNEFNFDEKSRQSSSIGRTRAVRVFVAKCRAPPSLTHSASVWRSIQQFLLLELRSNEACTNLWIAQTHTLHSNYETYFVVLAAPRNMPHVMTAGRLSESACSR